MDDSCILSVSLLKYGFWRLHTHTHTHTRDNYCNPLGIEEIEGALKLLKPNRSGGVDGLRAEHFKYGGEHLKLWLMKIFTRFLILEDVLQVNSYRGITLSPVLSKIFEIVLLQRLSPLLQDSGSPDILQTAYQRDVSCMDAIFATQEALLTPYREGGGHPYLCLFDLEKAFDSVELPVLLHRLFDLGINGSCWRLVKNWYTGSNGRVRVDNILFDPFPVE